MRYRFIVAIALLCSTSLFAATSAERLVQKLNAIKTFSAQFTEKIESEAQAINESKGHLDLKRPGRLRWETKSPTTQIVLADGKEVWIYDIELEQATIKAQNKALIGTPALFLSEKSDALTQDYSVTSSEKSSGQELFELKPYHTKTSFAHMTMVFNHAQLEALRLVDRLGQKTTILFSNVKQNQPISGQFFKLSLPKGVDIIRE